MAKANNTNIYKYKEYPSLLDYLFGTDFEDSKKNKSFRLNSIIQLINNVNGINNTQFIFSDGSDSEVSYFDKGYFFTDNNETNPSNFTKLILNKESLQPINLTLLFERLAGIGNLVMKLENPANPNNFFNFKITAISDETDFFVFDVEVFEDFFFGELLNETIYSVYFDIKTDGLTSGKLDKAGYDGTAAILDNRIAVLENQTDTQNVFVEMQSFSFQDNVLTILLGWIWKLAGVQYSNIANVMFTIPFCATGKTRLEYFVPNNTNGFTRIVGEETLGIAQAPQLPAHGLYVTYFLVTDSGIGTPQDPNINKIPNIDEVLGVGYSTNKPIWFFNQENSKCLGITSERILFQKEESIFNEIRSDNTTESYNTQLPNKTGSDVETIAMLSDLALKLDASDYNQHFKGVYLTEAALFSAHPTASVGDYAQVNAVGATDVVNYNWDAEESIWVKNEVAGSGATNTDALPEGVTNLYFTVTRFLANLTGTNVIAALGFTPSTAPNNAQKNSDITKAEIEAKLTGEITSHTHANNGIFEPNIWRTKILESNSSQQNADLINADINAAKLVNGVVLLPAGNFKSRKINWDPRVLLKGAGKRATTLMATNAEPLIEYTGETWYYPIGNIEGMNLKGGIDKDNKIGTSALNIQRVTYFHFKNLLFQFFSANTVELKGCLIGQFEDCNVENCFGGFNAILAPTSSIGYLQSNLVKFNNCTFNSIASYAIKWDTAANIQFSFCDFEFCGTNGDVNTGILKATNISPASEGIGILFHGCWGEFNYGTLFSIQGNTNAKHSFRDSMIQYGTATKGLVLNGGSVLLDNSTIPFSIDITNGIVENRISTVGTITLIGDSRYKKYESENLTGTLLDLSNPNGDNYNHTTPSSSISYTTKNKVEGAFVSCIINTATEPIVNGATKITGATYVANTNIEMIVEVKNNALRYFFLSI